jgi:ubiquinol-cytochrome c reductase cytochrome b subunit
MDTQLPAAKAAGFWESRTHWRALKDALLLEPLSGGSRWAAAFGSLLLFTFLVQVVTGILLAMNYAPAVKTAWPSVQFIQKELPWGWFIRGLHHWGASAMIILVLLHLIQVFVWGAYKRPRELTWLVGVLLLACTLGLAFTGYLLPWDEKAYWATKVGLGIASTVPLLGDSLRTLLQGGDDLGNLTLTRFFTLHGFILPIALALLAVIHLYLFRVHGVTPRWWASPEQLKAEEEPFWPGQAWKDAVLALAILIGLGVWCHYWPAPLGAEADPSRPYAARPEWYFMFLFRLLKYFEGRYEVLGTFVLPALFFLGLFFWPFLDRNPQRDPRRRPIAMLLLILGAGGLLGSTIYSIASDVRLPEPATAIALQPSAVPPAGPLQKMDIARIYQENCAACHDASGSGQAVRAAMPTIPDFRSMAWQIAKTDMEITHQIQDGSQPRMPPFGAKLTQAQILGLTIYLRAFAVDAAATPAPPAKPIAVKSPAPAAAKISAVEPSAAKESPPRAAQEGPPPAQIFRDFCLACHGADGRGSAVRPAMAEIPDFTAPAWQAARRDADLRHSILEGKGKFMLPMKGKLTSAQVEQMVPYVRKFAGGQQIVPVEKPPAAEGPSLAFVAPKEKPPKAVVKPLAPQPPPVVETRPISGAEVSAVPAPSETSDRLHFATANFRQYCLTCHGTDGHGTAMRPTMPAIPDFVDPNWQRSRSNAQLRASVENGKGGLMPAFGDKLKPQEIRDLIAYVRAFGPLEQKPPRPGADPSQRQYDDLQQQWNELQKQLQELSPRGGKP